MEKFFQCYAKYILLHDFKLFPLVAQIQHSLALFETNYVLPISLKSPFMRITYRLQVPDNLLKRIASAFKGLYLGFDALYHGYIFIYVFSTQQMSIA